jgi:hypothetical protein
MKPTYKPSYSALEVLLFIERFSNDYSFLSQLQYLVILENERYSQETNEFLAKRFKSKLINWE